MGDRAFAALRALGVSALAGLIAGVLVVGLGGRIAMRVAGALTNSPPGSLTTSNGNALGAITLEGTLAIIVFVGIPSGILGGVLYAAMRPTLARFGGWAGALFGVAALALVGSTVIDPQNIDFRVFGKTPLNVAMFAALFVLFGLAIVPLYGWVEHRSRGATSMGEVQLGSIASSFAALAALAGLAVAVYAVISTLASFDRATAADQTVAIAVGLSVLVVAASLLRASRRSARFADLAIAALLLIGAIRTASDLATLLA